MKKTEKKPLSMFSQETLDSLEMAEILGGITNTGNCLNMKGCGNSTNTGTCINYDCGTDCACGSQNNTDCPILTACTYNKNCLCP